MCAPQPKNSRNKNDVKVSHFDDQNTHSLTFFLPPSSQTNALSQRNSLPHASFHFHAIDRFSGVHGTDCQVRVLRVASPATTADSFETLRPAPSPRSTTPARRGRARQEGNLWMRWCNRCDRVSLGGEAPGGRWGPRSLVGIWGFFERLRKWAEILDFRLSSERSYSFKMAAVWDFF